jgi:hypothetical protein
MSEPTEQDFKTTYATLRYISMKHLEPGSDDWNGAVEGMRQTLRAAFVLHDLHLDEND